jgi:hypothetical protein
MSAGMVKQLGEASDKIKQISQTIRVYFGGALLWVSDLMERVGIATAMVINIAKGLSPKDSIKVMLDQLNELEAKQAARNNPDEPDARGRRDAEEDDKVAKKNASEAARLREQLADQQDKNAAKQRSDLQEIAELQMEQVTLEEQINSAQDESAETLRLKLQYEKNAAEILDRQKKIEDDEVESMKQSAEFRERIQAIDQEAYETRRKAAFEQLSTEDKIKDLQLQIAQNVRDTHDADAERTAQLNKQRAELDGQLTTLRQVKAEEDKRRMAEKVDKKLMSPAERAAARRDQERRERAERAIRSAEASAAATKAKNAPGLLKRKAEDDKKARQAKADRDFIGPRIPENMRPDFAQPAGPDKPQDLKAALQPTQNTLTNIYTVLDNRLKFPKLGGGAS